MQRERLEVLVIHGAGEPRKRGGDIYWKPLLEAGLGPEYRIQVPRMPQPEDPHHEAWATCIAARLAELDRPYLVGHSLGASTLLKLLAQAAPRPVFGGLFLIATPFWGRDFPEYALTSDELRRLADITPVFFYQSRDDDVVELAHLEAYRKAFPRASFRLLENRGHEFDQEQFPELVQDIRAASGQIG